MFILLMFFTNIPSMIVGEFASCTECEQVRLELLVGEPRRRIQLICIDPRDHDRR